MQSKESLFTAICEDGFQAKRVFPTITAEIEDSALLKVFGEKGFGIFNAPSVIEHEIIQQYGVKPLEMRMIKEFDFYAISAERELEHPGVTAITGHFRSLLSGEGK